MDYDKHLAILRENIIKNYNDWCSGRASSIFHREMTIYVKPGRKFDRIFTVSVTAYEKHSSDSIWGLVAKKDCTHKGLPVKAGDVFKPAGRKAAAKHVRGSIFSDDIDWFSWTGPEYMFTRKNRLEAKELC
jgi:hypothetical protein